MDTSLDSEDVKDGMNFSARTVADMRSAGRIIIPAGSVVKGKIRIKNLPEGLVLQFEAIKPSNNQVDCPLVATLVAGNIVSDHGRKLGIVHISRGRRSLVVRAIILLPVEQESQIVKERLECKPTPACIAFGVKPPKQIVLICRKKTGSVDIQSVDEMDIEIADDLRIPGSNFPSIDIPSP